MTNTHTAYIKVVDEEGDMSREEQADVLERDIEAMIEEVEDVEVIVAP